MTQLFKDSAHLGTCPKRYKLYTTKSCTCGYTYAGTVAIFVIAIDIFLGHKAKSIALVADALHALGDIFMYITPILIGFSAKEKFQKIGGRINGVFLTLSGFFVAIISFYHVFVDHEQATGYIMILAGIGTAFLNIVQNEILFLKVSPNNMRNAIADHNKYDAQMQIGVILAGILLFIWPQAKWVWILDPMVSFLFAFLMIKAGVDYIFSGEHSHHDHDGHSHDHSHHH